METKKWEAMLTAVELGSFTRAAARLGLTQSGLTHMMNALEKEVGFPLLLRDRYGVRLTAGGERLLPAVQELIDANRRLEGQIAAQNNQKRENIRVAAYSSICMHWLPTIVQQFRWAYPDVSVDIRMGSVAEIFQWLREGKVDPVQLGPPVGRPAAGHPAPGLPAGGWGLFPGTVLCRQGVFDALPGV